VLENLEKSLSFLAIVSIFLILMILSVRLVVEFVIPMVKYMLIFASDAVVNMIDWSRQLTL
jgi:antibiotic biosynthesis monooxygenase (ABM) superfamily enzyme